MNRKYLVVGMCPCILMIMPFCYSRVVEIVEPRKKITGGFKTNAEIELSFFTESIGFVDDEHKQNTTPWENFLNTYLSYKTWHEASRTKITKKNFPDNKGYLCSAYLSDPIFRSNNIFQLWSRPKNPILYELKRVRFNYFTREDEFIKVVRCSVLVKKTETQLYFHEIHYNLNQYTRIFRGYFVFGNISVSNSSDVPLELLTYTVYNKIKLPDIDTSEEEAEIQDSTGFEVNSAAIQFHIKMEFVNQRNNLRAFGEKAELFFLAVKYGFIDYDRRSWKTKKLILILDSMRKGYELDTSKMEKVKEGEKNKMCSNYITKNHHLAERSIFFQGDQTNNEPNWTTKRVQFPLTKLLPPGRRRELLQCPTTFGENTVPGNLYLLPVYYQNPLKIPQLFTFEDDAKTTDKVNPLILSAIHENLFEEVMNISKDDKGKDVEKTMETTSESTLYGVSSSINPHQL